MRFLPKDKAFDTDMVPAKRIVIQVEEYRDNRNNFRTDIPRAARLQAVDRKNS